MNITFLIAKINFGSEKTCDLLSRKFLVERIWRIEYEEKRKIGKIKDKETFSDALKKHPESTPVKV